MKPLPDMLRKCHSYSLLVGSVVLTASAPAYAEFTGRYVRYEAPISLYFYEFLGG